VCFFFFQAEDGIRDFHVTGVQTCALPIWGCPRCSSTKRSAASPTPRTLRLTCVWTRAAVTPLRRSSPRRPKDVCAQSLNVTARRSEERRVGKECRCGGGRGHLKKKG